MRTSTAMEALFIGGHRVNPDGPAGYGRKEWELREGGEWGGVVANNRMSSNLPLPLAAFITAVGGTLFAGIRESYWVPAL